MLFSSLGPGAFRYLLALLVLVEHLSRFQVGKVSVMVFFMLSGYWVTRMYQLKYARFQKPVMSFYVSRVLRIWPLYFFVLILAIVFAVWMNRPVGMEYTKSFLIFGVGTHRQDLTNVSWSLDVEMQFYLILPVLLAIMTWPKDRIAGWFIGVVMFSACLFGWGLNRVFEFENVLLFLPVFCAGALINLWTFKPPVALARVSVVLFVVAAMIVISHPTYREFLINGSDSRLDNRVFAMIWALLLIPFVAFNVRQKSSDWDRALGNASYALYLVHYPLLGLGRHLLGRDYTILEKPIAVIIVTVLSFFVYLLVDARLEIVRSRILTTFEK